MQQSIPMTPETIVVKTTAEEMVLTDVANGAAAATFMAGGIGAAALGLIVPLSEAIPAFKTALIFNAGVGPLSGKTIVPMVIYLVAWAVLGMAYRGKNVNMRRALTMAFVGMAIGLIGTFPPFYDMFTAT